MPYDNQAKIPTHVGKHGDHPVGGAIGAAVGAAAGAAAVGAVQGAAMGTVGGLPGMAAGVAIGGVVGALVGKGAAQEINPTTEDVYWSKNYKTRPYVEPGAEYDSYGPAYRYGVEAHDKFEDRGFEEIEPQLSKDWEKARGDSALPWGKAQPAARDAYERLQSRKTIDNNSEK